MKTLTLELVLTRSAELQTAIMRFGRAYLRCIDKYPFNIGADGIPAVSIVTDPPELSEELRAARTALIDFGDEWPLLKELDYNWQSERIRKALGSAATEDEYSEDYGAAEPHIKQIEDRLAIIGLQLHKASK